MGLIILESHDRIGYVIKKNPASGLQKRQSRFCEMSGMYKMIASDKNVYDPTKYLIQGTDYKGCSFSLKDTDEDHYVNAMVYSSSVFVISAINAFFDTPLKKTENDDTPFNHSLYINSLQLSDKQFDSVKKLTKYFDGIFIDCTQHSARRSVTFRSENTTLNYFLNVVFVMLITITAMTKEQMDVCDSLVEKIIKCMNRCNAPYFIRYYFVSRVMTPKDFKKHKKSIEQHLTKKISLCFGSTLDQRMNELEKRLTFKLPIVDIGCGEGNYVNKFAGKIKSNDIQYIGFDIDENELDKAKYRIKNKDITLASVTNDINVVYAKANEFGKVEMLITEVIEHMELDKVKEFIETLINNINFSKVLITTPNHDFNVNYDMDKVFRHHDHKWELGKQDFHTFIKSLEIKNCDIHFFDIGDIVDNVCCTLGVEIVRT